MNLASLRNLHRDTEGSFTLPGLDPRTRDRLSRLRVSEFFDVPEIQSILVNYGYRSEVRPNPEVPAGERYARFYQPQSRVERFRAYLSIITGKGLVIGLDQLRLAQLTWDRMGPLPEFSSRIEQELASVASAPLQQLLDIRPNPQSHSIIKLLHALEHALLFSLVREIGLEDFDSRLILRDGAIVIFETRDLGDGGLEQVARRPGFASDWLDRSLRQLEACPQACRDACIACVRVDNASCHGFLYRELPRWMPPNLLMDRHLAIRWTEADASAAA